jgi:hypothetical protein
MVVNVIMASVSAEVKGRSITTKARMRTTAVLLDKLQLVVGKAVTRGLRSSYK